MTNGRRFPPKQKPDRLRHSLDDLGARQHADLDRRHLKVGERGRDLRPNHAERHGADRLDHAGILRGQRGDRAGAMDAKRGESLEVGLDSRAAAGIGTGDGQGDRRRLFHVARVAPIHWRARPSGSELSVMSVTTETMSAPASRQALARSMSSPPIATSGMAPIRRFHSAMRARPCGAKAIALSRVG